MKTLLWLATWIASPQGPYPLGNPLAQPDLRAVLPGNTAEDQTFRMIVKPDVWGAQMRVRFSNLLGTKPLVLDGAWAGLHAGSGAIAHGANRRLKFEGAEAVTIPPGQTAWSDPVAVKGVPGGKLAISFHVRGSSAAMTWHAKALQTSYLSAPKAGSRGAEETSDAFPFTTTSWFFIDAVETTMPRGGSAIVAFGDSITDGTNSTINGDDRWPDFLSQRIHAAYGDRISVLNAGIGGNQILRSGSGGPAALERLDRDVFGVAGVKAVIWLEGINDLGSSGATAQSVIDGFRQGVAKMHARGVRVIGATITSSLGSTVTHGTADVDARRRTINEFIRHGDVFDAVADFDAATVDPKTGELRAEFQPSSAIGGPGDKLHPNRAGYQAMAGSLRLNDAVHEN